MSLVSPTEAFLDLTAPFGDIVALLVAKVAEMELAAISERNRSAAQYNLRAGKYRGGISPWGYLPSDSSREWRLVQAAEQVAVIDEVVRRVLENEPLRSSPTIWQSATCLLRKTGSRNTRAGRSTVTEDAVERLVLSLLGDSERLERLWDAGSDNSSELTEVNDTLTDLTGLVGTGPYKGGTPQRTAVDHRITELAARQAHLSSEAVPTRRVDMGYPTGVKFGDWWGRQDVTQRNIWLRSIDVRG